MENSLLALAVRPANVLGQFNAGQQAQRQEQQFKVDQDKQLIERLQGEVMGADTPEKWNDLISRAGSIYGADNVARYASFDTRNQLFDDLNNALPERRLKETQKQNSLVNLRADRNLNALQEQRNTTNSLARERLEFDKKNTLAKITQGPAPFTDTGKINVDERRNNITPKQAEGLRAKEISGKSTSIQNKVATLVASGLTQQQAQGVAAGRFAVSLNPATGERVLVDKGTQEILPLSQPVQASQAGEIPTQPDTSQSVSENPTLSQATEDATGVVNNFQALAATMPLGIGNALLQNFPGAQDAVRAKQVFKVAENALIRSFSLNPKFPVAEQKRILSLLPSTGVFSSDQDAKIKLEVLSNDLKSAIETNMTLARSRAPISERNAALVSAAAMQKFIDVIGVGTEIPTVSSVEEARRLPKGTRFKDPQGNTRIR